jgi:hypothetical protein
VVHVYKNVFVIFSGFSFGINNLETVLFVYFTFTNCLFGEEVRAELFAREYSHGYPTNIYRTRGGIHVHSMYGLF